MVLCLATNNQHKVEELQAMLGSKYELKTLADIGCSDEIPETENTFQGNSRQKAIYIRERFGVNCIADDSGLEVEALSGEPGVFSARYAGEHGNHTKNNELLLKNLKGITDRSAQFRCVITLILGDDVHQFDGIIRGTIAYELKGAKGFGYDPLFIPEGYVKSFAEMTPEEKNPISHRGLAVAKLINFLDNLPESV